MRDFDRIKERLEDAADYAERLLKLLQRMSRGGGENENECLERIRDQFTSERGVYQIQS